MENVQIAMSIVTDALSEDKDYYYSWQANIAMAFVDEAHRYQKKSGKKSLSRKDIHTIANTAAKTFLDLLIK